MSQAASQALLDASVFKVVLADQYLFCDASVYRTLACWSVLRAIFVCYCAWDDQDFLARDSSVMDDSRIGRGAKEH